MNLHTQFGQLIPRTPLRIGEVTAHNSDGTSTLQIAGGGVIRARGQEVPIGSNAFIQGGEVRGQAPDLPAVSLSLA